VGAAGDRDLVPANTRQGHPLHEPPPAAPHRSRTVRRDGGHGSVSVGETANSTTQAGSAGWGRYSRRVTGRRWILDPSDGELLVRTGVTGRAAKIGHRLTIALTSWQAEVSWNGSEPAAVELTAEMDSLEVLMGQGGVKPLSAPEMALARSNALKSLDADQFARIRFYAGDIEKTGDGYRLTGTLEIHGKSRKRVIDLRVEDLGESWQLSSDAAVRQSDFGIKPYSMLMGSVKVVDEVKVSLTVDRPKDR
jgi:polyisoprenoid-binding protein YceI